MSTADYTGLLFWRQGTQFAIDDVWARKPHRVYLHVSTYDHWVPLDEVEPMNERTKAWMAAHSLLDDAAASD